MPRLPTLSIRIAPELRAKLEEIAKAEGRTLANLIVRVLTEYVAAREAKRK
jgi:predicted transcriptional regulator